MTDKPHTPSTERIRQNYVDYQYLRYADNHMAPPGIMQRYAEFDRWLATIETAAEQRGAAKAWDEGAKAIKSCLTTAVDGSIVWDWEAAEPHNPYRADQEGDA